MLAIFLFTNDSPTRRSIVSPEGFKHVNLVTYEGDRWIWFNYADRGVGYRILTLQHTKDVIRFLKKVSGARYIVAVDIPTRKKYKWWPWCINTCQQMMQRFCGLDVPWSITPMGLYKKLFKFNLKTNYEIIYDWKKNYGPHSSKTKSIPL